MSVKMSVMTIQGAPLEGLSPLPMFHSKNPVSIETTTDFPVKLKEDLGIRTRVLPYKVQDRYSRKRVPINMKTIVLENEYLRATFWPENGGRLYSLFDKVEDRELLMSNPVYQPGNLAIRNAWISGGIEWNFGIYGHTVFTCDHLFAAVLKDDEDNEFVRMYELERAKNTIYQMDFHLPEGSHLLYAHVKIFNPFDTDTTTYWWTNTAIPEDGNTRVLSSIDQVISAVGDTSLTYEKLPYISSFQGKDMSYPHHANRSSEYFYQAPEGTKTTWQAGVNNRGQLIFDRSTAPLLFHKMFCWGTHSAGDHWQEFLSEPGKGYYIELQAGIARSQLHDKIFPAKSSMEWTQCFGGASLDRNSLHQESFAGANAYLGEYIDEVISEEELLRRNDALSLLACKEVVEADLVHFGSGWGALEQLRAEDQENCVFPVSVCFPKSTIGSDQYPWYMLLTEGKLPETAPDAMSCSFMVSPKWMDLLEKSFETGGGNWNSYLHYGIMLNERMDEEHVTYVASRWSEYPKYMDLARNAFLKSIEYEPSVLALRCLFCVESVAGNDDLAEKYYDKVFERSSSTADVCYAIEYMSYLNEKQKYKKCWNLYESLPEHIRETERVVLCAAVAAIKLRKMNFVEMVFEGEYADIKEGEASLTTIWFEYCALKLARERGLGEDPSPDELNKLIDEAWDICPPPAKIDFRMSFDKCFKYRMEE